MFEDYEKPLHIARVDNESRTLFGNLRGDKERMANAFRLNFESIDLEVAWAVFDRLSYQIMFQETGGEMETLYDHAVRSRILSRIFQRWPIQYYLTKLERAGIMGTVDNGGSIHYYFNQTYKPSIKTLSMPSPTRSGS